MQHAFVDYTTYRILLRIEVESIAASALNRERYVQWVMMIVRMNIPCVYGETIDILTLT